jgi:hypothetical protein
MFLRLTIVLCCSGAFAAAERASAAPVTGWTIVDSTTGGATTKSLTGAATDSPVVGTGADGSASQIALYAPISGSADTAADISLVNGQTVTLTGSATLVGSASSMEQFRFGLFYEGSPPVDAKGWLGYIANNSANAGGGALRAKRASYFDFHNLLFAATSAAGSSFNLQTSVDGGSFSAGTYDFSMAITRTGSSLVIDAALTRGTAFAQIWDNVLVTDPDYLTFNFNRVGFLSGNSSSADQITFSGVDVTTTITPSLTLEILASGPEAGAMRIVNDSGMVLDVDYYEITSPSGSLDAIGWNSLDDQSPTPAPAGWHEAGGSDEHLLSEANILGSTILPVDGVVRLGHGFEADGVEDLQFSVGLTDDRLIAGSVVYITPGDFNADGSVDVADLAEWKSGFGAGGAANADADFDGDSDGSDFLAWQRSLGASTGVATAMSVPESAAIILAGPWGAMLAALSRRRAAR